MESTVLSRRLFNNNNYNNRKQVVKVLKTFGYFNFSFSIFFSLPPPLFFITSNPNNKIQKTWKQLDSCTTEIFPNLDWLFYFHLVCFSIYESIRHSIDAKCFKNISSAFSVNHISVCQFSVGMQISLPVLDWLSACVRMSI